MAFSYRREHAGEDLEAEVLLVSKAVCSALDDPDLVVESLDEAERDFVLRATVGGYPSPRKKDKSFQLPCPRASCISSAGVLSFLFSGEKQVNPICKLNEKMPQP
jgi:hypothetical protein